MTKPLLWLRNLMTVGFLIISSNSALSRPAPNITIDCHAHGSGPLLTCDVIVKDTNDHPISDAEITLKAQMPSMPMAHSVKPVKAAVMNKNGLYRGTLQLQMTGIWTIEVDIRGPFRERVTKRIDTEAESEKSTRKTKHKHH